MLHRACNGRRGEMKFFCHAVERAEIGERRELLLRFAAFAARVGVRRKFRHAEIFAEIAGKRLFVPDAGSGGDDAAVGNHVVILVAATAEAALDLFLRLRRQHVVRQRVHVKIFLPLAGERAAGGVQCCCNQSHMSLPSSLLLRYFFVISSAYRLQSSASSYSHRGNDRSSRPGGRSLPEYNRPPRSAALPA